MAVAQGTPTSFHYSYALSSNEDSIFITPGDTICNGPNSGGLSVIGGFTARNFSTSLAIIENNAAPGWKFHIERSIDSFSFWQTIFPVDTSGSQIYYSQVFEGARPENYFILGGRLDTINGYLGKVDDYLESIDTGRTWNNVSSVAGGRVFFLANPDTNILWAVVGREPEQLASYALPVGNFADSMFYSSDGGATWSKDGMTFQGDTILAMRWLTKNNGYVITYRDSNTYLYHYTEEQLNIVTPSTAQTSNLTLYPNPATNVLNLVSLAGTISISDPLGRSYAVPRNGDALDISTLPPGVYFVSDGVSRAKFVKE